MCRWFSYIGQEPCLLEDVLVIPEHAFSNWVQDHFLPKLIRANSDTSIEHQQHESNLRNKFFNIDGLGMAWYTRTREEFGECVGERPCLYKTVQPPMNDPNFRSICANTSTYTLFAHIRATTSTAINSANNHPFVFGRHSFMHNGAIAHFSLIRREFAMLISQPVFEMVFGTTDSEYLAALYITNLGDCNKEYSLEEMKTALEKTIIQIIALQRKLIGDIGASSLNLAITDGTKLMALRFRNHASEQPPSLYYSNTAGICLNRKFPGHPDHKNSQNSSNGKPIKNASEHGKHVIIASEPITFQEEDWNLIPKNTFVLVDEKTSLQMMEAHLDL